MILPSRRFMKHSRQKSKDRFDFPKWRQEIDEYIAYRLWQELVRVYME